MSSPLLYPLRYATKDATEGAEHMISTRPCTLSVDAQIQGLSSLEEGWLDGTGTTYNPALLQAACNLFTWLLTTGALETPYVYPTEDGAIRAEWDHPKCAVIVTLDAKAEIFSLFATAPEDPKKATWADYRTTEEEIRQLAERLSPLLART